MHLNDGQLRAYLDHQEPILSLAKDDLGRELAESKNHLAVCANCRVRADELATQAERVAAHLAALDLPSSSVIASRPERNVVESKDAAPLSDSRRVRTLLAMTPHVALARFKTRRLRKESLVMQKISNRRYRPAWALIALVVLIAVSMTLPPVRAWAQGVLAQFRVAKVTVVSVDPTRFSDLGIGSQLGKQIGQLLSDSITVTKKPAAPRVVANAAEASQSAGFAVRQPTSRSDAPRITVQDSAVFQFVVNRARAQALLNDAGASNLKLPASIDGAVIKVNIPAAIAAAYGDCPKLEQEEVELNAKGSPGRTMINCIILTEIPSPSVDAPPDLDVAQIAELGLQFTGMTKEQAHAYAQTVDWTSTLVIPIPRNAAQYKQVSVDGVTGYLMQRPLDDAPQYAIVWVKNGIIYAIGGLGDATAAMSMANSLK